MAPQNPGTTFVQQKKRRSIEEIESTAPQTASGIYENGAEPVKHFVAFRSKSVLRRGRTIGTADLGIYL